MIVHKFLIYINTGPYDFIHGPWEKLKTSDEQNNKIMLSQRTQSYYRITSFRPCINHFQPLSRPSCQWNPNFKQRFWFHSTIVFPSTTMLTFHHLVHKLFIQNSPNLSHFKKPSWSKNIHFLPNSLCSWYTKSSQRIALSLLIFLHRVH